MKEIRLEVGRTYMVRDPEYYKQMGFNHEVTIIRKEESISYPFVGDNYDTYAEDGLWNND